MGLFVHILMPSTQDIHTAKVTKENRHLSFAHAWHVVQQHHRAIKDLEALPVAGDQLQRSAGQLAVQRIPCRSAWRSGSDAPFETVPCWNRKQCTSFVSSLIW